jgi:hypothetical protein
MMKILITFRLVITIKDKMKKSLHKYDLLDKDYYIR